MCLTIVGVETGSLLVSDLLKLCDVCLIQEHWLLNEQLHDLNINNEFFCVVSVAWTFQFYCTGTPLEVVQFYFANLLQVLSVLTFLPLNLLNVSGLHEKFLRENLTTRKFPDLRY